MDILNEVISKPAVRKVMQFRNPKFIEAEYILTRVKPPRKEKEKFNDSGVVSKHQASAKKS